MDSQTFVEECEFFSSQDYLKAQERLKASPLALIGRQREDLLVPDEESTLP